jgi:hypothetical protein
MEEARTVVNLILKGVVNGVVFVVFVVERMRVMIVWMID